MFGVVRLPFPVLKVDWGPFRGSGFPLTHQNFKELVHSAESAPPSTEMHGQSYSKDFSWAPRYRQVFINDFLTGFSKQLFNNNLEIKAGSFASTVRHAPYIIIRSSMMLKEALATPRYGHSTTIKNYKRRCTYCVIFLSYAALDAGKSRISNSITVNYFCLRFAQLFSFYYLCKSNPKGLSGILLF